MGKLDIAMNKKTIVVISAIVAAGLFFFALIMPLFSKASRLSSEVKALDSDLEVVREALDRSKRTKPRADFLSRLEVSIAIDEMTNVGADMNINFLSTSPQAIRQLEGMKHSVLPISMVIQSEYEDLGVFLVALEHLEKSVVTVKEFVIHGDPAVLPRLITEIVVEVHLKENERG